MEAPHFPPIFSRSGRRKSGISELMAVLLMIIAAIAIAALVWIYAASQAQSLSRNPSIDIVDARVIATQSGSGMATIGVKNTGSVAVTITKIQVSDPGGSATCSFSDSKSINPGGVAYFTSDCSNLQPGQKLVIVVEGISATNEEVKALGSVMVM